MSIPVPGPNTDAGKLITYFRRHQFALGLVVGLIVGLLVRVKLGF